MATVDLKIEELRAYAAQSPAMLAVVDNYARKALAWEQAPTTMTWTFDTQGCPAGAQKRDNYSCSVMYTRVNIPPVIVPRRTRGSGGECKVQWTASPDKRSVSIQAYRSTSGGGDDAVYIFVFEKVPKEDFVFM